MRRRTDGADADLSTLKVGQPLEPRLGDQDMKRAVKPSHYAFDRQTLDRRPREDAADRGVVELAGDQRGDLQVRAHDDFAHLEAFVSVKAFALSDLGRQLIETGRGDADIYDLGAGAGRRRQRENKDYQSEKSCH